MGSALDFPLNWFAEDRPETMEGEFDVKDADLDVLDDTTTLRSPLRLNGDGYRRGSEVYVTLKVDVDAEFQCGRCLEPVPGHLSTHFTILYRPVAKRPAYLEAEDETGLGYYESGIIAVGEDVRRYLLLELPLWPVCSQDCLGLCPHCGINMNRESCNCAAEHGAGAQTELARKLDQLLP